MKLFTPIKIGEEKVKNRIVMAAMHLGYAKEGHVTERLLRFYEERARGGAGLIMVGGCSIDEHAYSIMVSVNNDKYIAGLSELTKQVKQHGAKIGCQLFHAGRYSYSSLTGIQSVAPSPIPSLLTREVPRELETAEIYKIIESFGQAALRAKKAGFNLVEIIGAAGYLIGQFLSPLTNLRTDEFGGSLENRMRFGISVVQEVRRQVGADFPISYRFAGHELMTGGTPRHELLVYASELAKAGLDLINITGGWHESTVPQITMDVPLGAFLHLTQSVKQVVDIPVVASNRINDPLQAERILLNRQADMVTIARGLIADPDWPAKAKEGRFKEIRKCIACNQGCIDKIFMFQSLECLVNAQAGREWEISVLPAEKKKRVLVIGGGPAGMEAARIARQRGHEVHLWERSEKLGGQLNLAAVPKDRRDFANLVDYLVESLYISGVQVALNQKADAQNVRELSPDVIIIASGARPANPPLPGIDKPHVVQAWRVLEQDIELGDHIAVVGGGAVGCETALYLARLGTIDAETVRFLMVQDVYEPELIKELTTRGIKNVTLIEQEKRYGSDIGRSTKWGIFMDLPRYGVQVKTSTKVVSIEDDGVIIEHNQQQSKLKADMVVIAAGSVPENELYSNLQGMAPEIYIIGDAKQPRKAMDAIHEGFHLGNRI